MSPSKKNLNNGKLLDLGIPEVERARLLKKYKSTPRSIGRKYAIARLEGEELTAKQAAQAHCFSCSGGYKDCINYLCPRFSSSFYADKKSVKVDPERIAAVIKDYEENTCKSLGNTYYLRALKGEKLTNLQINIAKCAECKAGYADGRIDSGCEGCELYPFMPYRGKR